MSTTNSVSLSESISQTAAFLVNVPVQCFQRVFSPLGLKTIRFINDRFASLGLPIYPGNNYSGIQCTPAGVIGVASIVATVYLTKAVWPKIQECWTKTQVDWAANRTWQAAWQCSHAVLLTAAVVSSIYFVGSGLLSGVVFGIA